MAENTYPTKLCVLVIFKDEVKIIKRCLDSLLTICDYFALCDTGSTDGTVELVQEWIKTNCNNDNNKIGKMLNFAWIKDEGGDSDYGANRTKGYQVAKDWLQEVRKPKQKLWFLLADADFEYQPKAWNPDELDNTMTAGLIYQGKKPGDWYQNIRLLNSKCDWECLEPTHEYWQVKNRDTKNFNVDPDKLWIFDHDDGFNRSDKYERDIRILKRRLTKVPNNERSWFYLAMSYYYQDADRDACIKACQRRVALQGFYLERWQCLIYIGDVYKKLNNTEECINYWSRAKLLAPDRAEPFCRLGILFCEQKQYKLAEIELINAKKCPSPDDGWFIDNPCYNYRIDCWLAITYYYQNRKQEGFKLNDRILFAPGIGSNEFTMGSFNMQHFIQPLAKVRYLNLALPEPVWGYNPTNPSIIATETGFLINIRAVNYYIKEDRNYAYPGYVHTRNFLCHMTKDFKLIKHEEIIATTPYTVKGATHTVKGLEDVRLFMTIQGLRALAASWNYHDGDNPQQCLLNLDEPNKTIVTHIPSPNNRVCEKNWMPFVENDKMLAVYEPSAIIDLETNKITNGKPNGIHMGRWRGSGGPVLFTYKNKSCYLMITHEVTTVDGKRQYWHRFVIMNTKYRVIGFTLPFYFWHLGIEMAVGLAIKDDHVYVTFGKNDVSAYVADIAVVDLPEFISPKEYRY
jgi:tetratricopeptide (TPR) repeat protein